MKKFCLMLAVFTFMSIMPSYAVKIIVNNETDRVVPSRSSAPDYAEFVEEQTNEEVPSYSDDEYRVNNVVNQQRERFNHVYKPILGRDIRGELVGTTWYYPEETYQQIQKQNQPQQNEFSDDEFNSNEFQLNNKHYIREAADYFVVDTINRPNEAVPVGYEEL